MYFPGASPRVLLVSRRLTIMPLRSAPQALLDMITQQIECPPDFGNPDPELLRNVLPVFEIYQDAGRFAASGSHRLSYA